MFLRCRLPVGAAVFTCAVALACNARAGAVAHRHDDDDRKVVSSGDSCRESEWVGKILGEYKNHGQAVAAQHRQNDKDGKAKKDKHDKSEKRHDHNDLPPSWKDDANNIPPGARPAAVIPLPAPLYSGLIGLGALAGGSVVRKLRRLL